MNVLILNVFNVFQEQGRWNGRLSEDRPHSRAATSFEDVIELSPKNGVWEAFGEESPSLDAYKPGFETYDKLTYNSRGGYTSTPGATGRRINLVV